MDDRYGCRAINDDTGAGHNPISLERPDHCAPPNADFAADPHYTYISLSSPNTDQSLS